MRRNAILASSVWIAVFASIALFTFFWRVGCFRPHPLWGVLSVVLTLTPMTWLAASALRRIVCGPCRLRAFGWLLVGATPVVWIGGYLAFQAQVESGHRGPTAPLRVAFLWVSTMADVEARWSYPRRTRGRIAVLIDDGRTPSPEKLVAQMDRHIQAMCDLLGQPVPEGELPWVRGSFLGFNRVAISSWAFCGQDKDPGELTRLDRHEVAHTLITVLSDPDHNPPSLLSEGWAESQERGRDVQIRYLAEKRKVGLAFSLEELVEPDMYRRGGAVYWQGGPVVLYLIQRYGPESFFRFYSAAREDSFFEDCQATLGDSWQTVEKDFWKWLEAEEELLAEADAKRPEVAHVELAPSVDPADWQALVKGCREAGKDPEPLPTNTAFVLEGEQVEEKIEAPGVIECTKLEFRAVFEGRQFWIFDNSAHDGERFLTATRERCADLERNDSGSLEGWVKGGWARHTALKHASDLLATYRADVDAARFLPPREIPGFEASYHIERVVRPTEGKTGRWTVWFTRRRAKDGAEMRRELELDAGQHWRITRSVGEGAGGWRYETDAECERVGDAFMPVTLQKRWARDQSKGSGHWRVRPLSEGERKALKERVERAVRSGPRVPHQRLRRFLLVIVVACPLGGATFLAFTRRCKPAKETP